MSKEPKSYKPKVAKPPELLEYCDWAGVIKLIEDYEAATRVERLFEQRLWLEAK